PTAPTPTPEPTMAPTEPVTDQARIAVDLMSCPSDYDAEANGEDAATFAANCADPAGNVLMTLTDSAGQPAEIATADNGMAVFSDLAPDTYTLFSDVPADSMTEYLFCAADD